MIPTKRDYGLSKDPLYKGFYSYADNYTGEILAIEVPRINGPSSFYKPDKTVLTMIDNLREKLGPMAHESRETFVHGLLSNEFNVNHRDEIYRFDTRPGARHALNSIHRRMEEQGLTLNETDPAMVKVRSWSNPTQSAPSRTVSQNRLTA